MSNLIENQTSTTVIPSAIGAVQPMPVSGFSLYAEPTFKIVDDQVEPPQILEEVLIEEVSIDGMCGVY